jgi:hypothetical protein
MLPDDSTRVNSFHCNLASESLPDDGLSGSMDVIYLVMDGDSPKAPARDAPAGLRAFGEWQQWNDNAEQSSGLVRNLMLARGMLKEGGILYLRCPASNGSLWRGVANVIFNSEGVLCDDGLLLAYTCSRLCKRDSGGSRSEFFEDLVPVQLTDCVLS